MAQIATPSVGKIIRLEQFKSKYVDARNVDVWLPEHYDKQKKYAVLYMHDGKMLFDSTITWNHQEWGIDETTNQLIIQNKIVDVIVVGIWNNGDYRHAEYFPQKALTYLPKTLQDALIAKNMKGKPQADNYLLFMTKELKPYIDSAFSVRTDKASTYVAGSSMGGLISLYAICEYPDVFGGAACISTHWPGNKPQMGNDTIPKAFKQYLLEHLPDPDSHKLYFSHGTATLDSFYAPHQQVIDVILKAKGYNATNYLSKVFDGDDHSENSWRRQMQYPLEFLLKK